MGGVGSRTSFDLERAKNAKMLQLSLQFRTARISPFCFIHSLAFKTQTSTLATWQVANDWANFGLKFSLIIPERLKTCLWTYDTSRYGLFTGVKSYRMKSVKCVFYL